MKCYGFAFGLSCLLTIGAWANDTKQSIAASPEVTKTVVGTPITTTQAAGKMIESTRAGAQAPDASVSHAAHVTFTPEQIRWTDGPRGLPAGVKMAVLSGDPATDGLFAARFRLPAGTRIRPHWHPADENVTVLSGTMKMGHGDVFKQDGAFLLPAGSFTKMPAKVHHFAWCDEETVIQLNSMGPWGITYVNPADDPRGAPPPATKP